MFDSDKNAEGELTPNIQNIAIDTRRKKIYWTDPTLTEGKGKIACSNYDGSDYKVVIHELHWPQGMFRTKRQYLLKGARIVLFSIEINASQMVVPISQYIKKAFFRNQDLQRGRDWQRHSLLHGSTYRRNLRD